jgi:hypothetical protein
MARFPIIDKHPLLPSSASEITAKWIQSALSLIWPDIRLQSITQRAIIHGSATKIQLALDHAPGSSGHPRSVWVKIGFEPYSDILNGADLYATEAICYDRVLNQRKLGAPRCYFQHVQTDPPQVAIILEDLIDYGVRFGRATNVCSIEEARAGLENLACIHAATWGRTGELEDLGLRRLLTWGELPFLNEFVDNADSYFHAARGYAVPLALHDKVRLARAWERYRAIVLEGPQCLLHGDSHVGNTFIYPDGRVGFLEWQCAAIGHWSHDVGYYLASALDAPVRREAEKNLLLAYLHALHEQGVEPPPFDEAWQSYRRSLFFAFLMWLGNSDATQPPEVNTACFGRAGIAMLDLDVYNTLGV